jgi:hypothetical protein
MTLADTTPQIGYDYNGVGDYTFNFVINQESDLQVVWTDGDGVDNTWVLNTDYTVTLDGAAPNTGKITTTETDTDGTLDIRRVVEYVQESDWVNNSAFDVETLEDDFDKIVMMIQQLKVDVDNGVATSNWQGAWATSTSYVLRDMVLQNSNVYICVSAHTSGVWATDLAAGYWQIVFDVADAISVSAATTSGQGIVELATNAECVSGTDTERAVTPDGLQEFWDNNGNSKLATVLRGYFQRSKLSWKDADEFYLGPAIYHHAGTVEQFIWWGSTLTKSVTGLSNNTLYYIYIDDSAIVTLGDNEITSAEITYNTTAPTWDDDYRGWYNGDDRCIGAFLSNGSGEILEFYWGVDHIHYAIPVEDQAAVNIDTTWTDVTLASVPDFCEKALISALTSSSAVNWMWRVNGQTGDKGSSLMSSGASAISDIQHNADIVVITDSAQKIEVKADTSDGTTIAIETRGYFFPEGM